MSGPLNNTVAIVDDEFLIVAGLTEQVEGLGLTVCGAATSADEAVELAVAKRPAVVLMDVRLGGEKDGVDAAIAIHHQVGSKVIFVTGSSEPATMERIRTDHPAGVLIKPVTDGQLRLAIDAALAS